MTTLAVLLAELQSEVPAVNSVPSTAQYTQAIKDAVAEFSRRCGVKKNTTISIISGTASYALPDDFIKLIEIDNPYDFENGVMISSTGIIPFGSLNPSDERITIQNKTLTIYPTPTYTMTRYLEYKAAWILTGTAGNETYAALGDDEVQVVMIKAKSLAVEKKANAMASSSAMKYSFGAVSVDKGDGADALNSKVAKLHDQFVEACDRYNGAFMTG
jgi:hypothetical protein